ncbi:MAG: hypothetical protein M3290_08260 [Actinomycetota bacterium]|nr:hypothetical protein [Actinomycetota bacterium]
MPASDRLSRWLIACAAFLCVAVIGGAIALVATYRLPSRRRSAVPISAASTSPSVVPPISPSRPAHIKPQPPVDPLAEIDQDQLLRCITATREVPGSHSQPDLTTLPGTDVVHRVARADEDVRDLHFTRKVPFDFITRRQIDRRVIRQTLSGYGKAEADNDSAILEMLGAVPPSTDLRTVAKDALGGQVAGFYDDTHRKLVVGTSGDGHLSASEVTTLAHELDHALTDQALGFPTLHDGSPLKADESLARHSLLEGDAVLDQTFFEFEYLSVAQQLDTSRDPAAQKADRELGSVPHYLTARFLFPYTEGLNFACNLYLHGGWIEIDSAYLDPPTTRAQIMWPNRYRKDEPAIDPPSPPTPSGWSITERSALGAADLKALFEAPGNDVGRALDGPRSKARAWAGGVVTLFRSSEESAMAMDLVQRRHSHGLCRSLASWYAKAFPDAVGSDDGRGGTSFDAPTQKAVLRCPADTVRLGIAPSMDVAEALAS